MRTKRTGPPLPRWAKIAIAVLGIVCFASTVVVQIFMDDILDFLDARIGFWGIVVGSLGGVAIMIWIASRFDD